MAVVIHDKPVDELLTTIMPVTQPIPPNLLPDELFFVGRLSTQLLRLLEVDPINHLPRNDTVHVHRRHSFLVPFLAPNRNYSGLDTVVASTSSLILPIRRSISAKPFNQNEESAISIPSGAKSSAGEPDPPRSSRPM